MNIKCSITETMSANDVACGALTKTRLSNQEEARECHHLHYSEIAEGAKKGI